MTSLILVQINSIYQALGIKEEQFDAAVKSALNQVVLRLEKEELIQSDEFEKRLFNKPNSNVFPNKGLRKGINQPYPQLSLQYKKQIGGNSYSEEWIID